MSSTIVNVKDFGASGGGSIDDTANIQLAIDAAFGPASAPHGGSDPGMRQNRAVYFPSGIYNISAPLLLTQVHGAHIYGDGKMATRIVNVNTSGGDRCSGSVFMTAGFSYGSVEHMTLAASAPVAATLTGSISGNTLTVISGGTGLQPGMYLSGASTALSNSSMVGSGVTITVTTSAPHGVPTNNPFQVTTASASAGYNGTWSATSTGASTFTLDASNFPISGTAAVPGTYSIHIVDGVQTSLLSGITWLSGTAMATATVPHGIAVGTSCLVVILRADSGRESYTGTYTATATSSTIFTYPEPNNPGGAATFGVYGLYPTIIVSGSLSTWTVSNSQNVASGPFTAVSRNHPFEMTWDSTQDAAITGGTALHQHTFRNVRFEGGDIGISIGDAGFMGSEITFIGCDFVGCAVGMTGWNFNALDFTVLGGSFQNCGIGIDTTGTATFSYVCGVSFSGSTTCDIFFRSFDGMVVEGCNSTSTKFLQLLGSVPMHTKACSHTPGTSGSYATPCQAFLIMDGCLVTNAVLQGSSGAQTPNAVYMRGNNVPGTFLTGSTSVPGPYPNPPTGPVMEFS